MSRPGIVRWVGRTSAHGRITQAAAGSRYWEWYVGLRRHIRTLGLGRGVPGDRNNEKACSRCGFALNLGINNNIESFVWPPPKTLFKSPQLGRRACFIRDQNIRAPGRSSLIMFALWSKRPDGDFAWPGISRRSNKLWRFGATSGLYIAWY